MIVQGLQVLAYLKVRIALRNTLPIPVKNMICRPKSQQEESKAHQYLLYDVVEERYDVINDVILVV